MAVTAADLEVRFTADTKDAERGIQRVNKGITGFAKTAAAVGAGVLGAAFFNGIARGFSGAGAQALDFGRNMANVNSIAQLSEGALSRLSDAVMSIAADPRVLATPAELASGLYDIYSSGFQAADALNILTQASLAATAGMTDTATAARAITSVLNAYGLGADQAAHISDVLFQTVNDGVITFEALANNMGNTIPIANSLGVTFEEVAAAYAQMTLNGVNASAAETQIAALMRSALNPTEALTNAVHEHGYASAADLIAQKGLAGYIDLVNEAAGGNKETLFGLVGTQEAMNAATILGNKHGKEYRKEIDKMNHASDGLGATNKALAKQMDSASFAITKMKQTVSQLAVLGFGILAPVITKAAGVMTRFISRTLVPFASIIGRATSANFAFGKGFDKLIKGLPQPIRRAVHAIASLTDALSDMFRHGFSRNELTQAFHAFQALGEELGQAVHWTFNVIIDAAVSLGELLIDGVKAAPGSIFGWVRDKLFGRTGGGSISQDPASPMYGQQGSTAPIDVGVLDVAVALGKLILNGATGVITDIAGWARDQIMGTAGNSQAGRGVGSGGFNPGVSGHVGVPIDAGVWDVAVTLGKLVVNGAAGAIGDLWNWVKEQIVGGGGPVGDATGGPSPAPGANTVDVGSVILSATAALGGDLKTAADDLTSWLKGKLSWPADGTFNFGSVTLKGSVAVQDTDGTPAGDKAGKDTVDRFVDSVKNNLQPIHDAGVQIASYLIGGVATGVGLAAGAMADVAGAVVLGIVAAIKDPQQIAKVGVGINDAINAGVDVTAWAFTGFDKIVSAFYSGLKAGFDASTPDLSFIADKLFGGISAGASQDPASPMYGGTATAGIFANLGDTLQLGLTTALDAFTPDVGDIGTRITVALGSSWVDALARFTVDFKPDFGFIGDAIQGALDAITQPSLPGWMTDLSWITDPLGKVQGALANAAGFGGKTPQSNRGEGGAGSKGYFQPMGLVKIPAPDTTDFDTGMSAIVDSLKQNLTNTTYTTTLDANIQPAVQQATAATLIGAAWQAATFTSHFDIDNGPAAIAYTNAFGWGATWAAQVFTARFSVDVSGLYAAQAVAYQVAANIAAVMPHSPAKRGPLSKPINFSFIADAARRDLSGLGNQIEGYLGTGRHQVGARGLRGGGHNITINALKSAELIKLIKKAENGDSFARGLGRELGLSGGF